MKKNESPHEKEVQRVQIVQIVEPKVFGVQQKSQKRSPYFRGPKHAKNRGKARAPL
jgi:hypothetical protein